MMKRFIFFVLLLAGCSSSQNVSEKYNETRPLMATVASIDVCVDESNKSEVYSAYQKVWQRLEEIAWRMNVFDEKSDVSKINDSQGQAIAIPQDTYFVLERALYFNQLTSGAFDITVMPLISLWKNASKADKMPTLDEIKGVLNHAGSGKLELSAGHHVRLVDRDVHIDLGGIAAGYAIDEAVQIFKNNGLNNFYIDIGGDIYAGGVNCRGERWSVGIIDPQRKDQLLNIVYLSNQSVTTSGNYEKFYTIGGKKYSHIIDPVTGYPQEEVTSATVIAPTAIEADALATGVAVLGYEEGNKLIDSLGQGYAAIIMSQEGSITTLKESQEFKKFKSKK